MRERMRLRKVSDGLIDNLSLNAIHHKTGITEKNIRKIMLANADEITFLLLKRQVKQEKK